MNTEIAEYRELPAALLLYDGECPACRALAARLTPLLRAHRIDACPLQEPWVAALVGPNWDEMKLLRADGALFGGGDAIIQLARSIWWARPFGVVGGMRIPRELLAKAYRRVATNRRCQPNGRCDLPKQEGRTGILWSVPLALLPVALVAGQQLEPWKHMWCIAFTLYALAKALTFRNTGAQLSDKNALRYLLVWPGMDARTFMVGGSPERPLPRDYLAAGVKTALGAALFAAGMAAVSNQPSLGAWIGMVGIILALHCGLFHFLSLLWARLGVQAKPIMNSPGLAVSLAEFWARRWNTAFSDLARTLVLRPIARRFGGHAAILGVFIVSGVVHELVISVPARGGYGLPTLYFFIQALGIAWQRRAGGDRALAGRRLKGWLVTMVVIIAPLPLLFHAPFVNEIVAPMLRAAQRLFL